MKIKFFKNENKPAYISLISVIIVGAVVLSIVLFMISSGLNATENSLIYSSSSKAEFLADACAEEALQQIRDNNNFTGTNLFSLGDGVCSYSVVNTGGSNRTINASSTVFNNVKKVRVLINSLSPKITVLSWQEIAD